MLNDRNQLKKAKVAGEISLLSFHIKPGIRLLAGHMRKKVVGD
jgi:hypothetical protein